MIKHFPQLKNTLSNQSFGKQALVQWSNSVNVLIKLKIVVFQKT